MMIGQLDGYRRRCSAYVWLGPIVSEPYLTADTAASAAGNEWQAGLVRAAHMQGYPIRGIAGTPHAAWPRGQLFAPPDATMLLADGLSVETVGYLNLPLIKLAHQHILLRSALRAQLRREGLPPVAFSYNAGYPEAATGRWLQREAGVPWVCVVADYPESSDPRVPTVRRAALQVYSQLQQKWIGQAAGRVFLSWELFQQDISGPKFHLEGGIASVRKSLSSYSVAKRVIMYSGSLSAYTGVDLLLAAFSRVREPSCELWVCGRGNLESKIRRAAEADSRIKFFGLVSRDCLGELMSQAHIFVNPRPSSCPENRANFPSKLLEYLSWCRPIVSTITPGMSPTYNSVLTTVTDETPQGLADGLGRVLALTAAEAEAEGDRIRCFAEERLLWTVQVRRLWNWLESECIAHI